MEIEEFAKITRNVISEQGIEGFLPTLALPEKRQIIALEGAPKEKEQLLSWAKEKSGGENEFLLAFKENENSFRIIRSFNGQLTENLYLINDD